MRNCLAGAVCRFAGLAASVLLAWSDADASGAEHTPAPVAAIIDDRVIATINEQIRAGWAANGLRPSLHATPHEWCRRVYLDLLGRVPTVEEIAQFEQLPAVNRDAVLVDKLLGFANGQRIAGRRQSYETEFAAHWANVFAAYLVDRPAMDRVDDPQLDREAFLQYLQQSIRDGKPYDRLVYELISAAGSTKYGADDFNPATNFLIDKLRGDGEEATNQVGLCFLGFDLRCAQCHNSPFSDTTKRDFWQLNAFFRQAQVSKQAGVVRLDDRDFKPESGKLAKAEIYFEVCRRMEIAYPIFLNGQMIDPHGAVAEVNRRTELARLVSSSDRLAPAMMNRLWGHFFTFGFTTSVEQMEDGVSISHPDLLNELGKSFKQSGYDLRRAMRWLVLSDPYRLSSRMSVANKKDDPALGAGVAPQFSHFYPRLLTPEQMVSSIDTIRQQPLANRLSTQPIAPVGAREIAVQLATTILSVDEHTRVTYRGTSQMALQFFNGPIIARLMMPGDGTIWERLQQPTQSSGQKTDYLFLATFGRRPSDKEIISLSEAIIASDERKLFEDLLWALVNSNEFQFNH